MSKRQTEAMAKLQKKHHNRPRKTGPWREAWYRLRRNKSALLGIAILVVLLVFAFFPNAIAPYGEDEQIYADAFIFPNAEHLLGTDNYGRDMFSRIVFGARTSLKIGIFSVCISLIVGGSLGLIAAFYGGKVDNVIMRFMDILYALPSFLLAIAVASSLGAGLFNLMLAIAISEIPGYARVTRAAAITIKGQEYLEAARSIGGGPGRLILKHILPNANAPIIVQATLGVANAILTGAALSFIGIGVQPPTAEWGYMLNAGRQYIRTHWYIVTFPGVMIMLTIFSFNLLGDGLRDALDPKLKR